MEFQKYINLDIYQTQQPIISFPFYIAKAYRFLFPSFPML